MSIKAKHLMMILGGAATATIAQQATAHADTVTVQKGDTTWGLAQKYGTSTQQIVKDNHLSNNGQLIYVGQQLQINKANSETSQQSSTNNAANQTTQQASQETSQLQNNGTDLQGQVNTSSNNSCSNYASGVTGNEAAAKAWIASRESGGNYNARNGQYIGKYQLSASYLGGDYSPAHQEQVADSYVAGRYGSWSNAQAFWQSHGWY